MKVELIDYDKRYFEDLKSIEENQWGKWDTDDYAEFENKVTHAKLAKVNDQIVGIGYGKIVGDAFYIQVIVIVPEYQHMHIGSMFMENFILLAKSLNLSNVICEGVLVNNNMNIQNIMYKFGFKEILRIKDYWGYKYPNVYCKECSSMPCKCTNVIFVKSLN